MVLLPRGLISEPLLYVDFSGGLWLLCWIVVVVVDVGPCTCISVYQVLLLSWRAIDIIDWLLKSGYQRLLFNITLFGHGIELL